MNLEQPKREAVFSTNSNGKRKRHRVRLKQQNTQPEMSEQPAGVVRTSEYAYLLSLFGRFFVTRRQAQKKNRAQLGAAWREKELKLIELYRF